MSKKFILLQISMRNIHFNYSMNTCMMSYFQDKTKLSNKHTLYWFYTQYVIGVFTFVSQNNVHKI